MTTIRQRHHLARLGSVGSQLPRVVSYLGRRTRPPHWRRLVTSKRLRGRVVSLARLRGRPEAGMSTAEYAVGTVAACAFAALLYKVITSSEILNLLTGVVSRALHVPF